MRIQGSRCATRSLACPMPTVREGSRARCRTVWRSRATSMTRTVTIRVPEHDRYAVVQGVLQLLVISPRFCACSASSRTRAGPDAHQRQEDETSTMKQPPRAPAANPVVDQVRVVGRRPREAGEPRCERPGEQPARPPPALPRSSHGASLELRVPARRADRHHDGTERPSARTARDVERRNSAIGCLLCLSPQPLPQGRDRARPLST